MIQDIEGNIYTSIIYGGKEWLVENWKCTKFADGSAIPNLQSPTTLQLMDGWANVSFAGITASGANITNALKTTGTGYIMAGLDGDPVALKAGDTLTWSFNLTLISLNLPRAVLYKDGVMIGSTLITAGVNTLNLSITSDGNYNVGFQSNASGSEFSTSGNSLTSVYNGAWESTTSPAYAWFNNDIANKPYGARYNHRAVSTGIIKVLRDGVYEPGWRVTSLADQQGLSTALGGDAVSGGHLKEIGTALWYTPNTGADDSIGYKLQPSGYREGASGSGGHFYLQVASSYLWTSDLYDISNAMYSLVVYDATTIIFYHGVFNNGFAVRAVRDIVIPTDPPEIGPGKVLTVGYEAVEFFDKFNITYSIGDIRDLSQGSSDKSYTIELPLTKKNRHILKHINQVDVKSEPVKRARIYMDELIIIQGKIYVLDYTDTHVKILINSDDWIENLKSRKMTELDLSASDHLLTNANVEASWSAADALYRYPMIDFGALSSGETGLTANWQATDFIPMIRIINLVMKILAPFTITSDWIALQFIKDLYVLGREKIADANFVNGKHLELTGDSYGDNTNTVSVSASATGTAILTAHKVEFNTTVTDEYPAWDALNSEYTVPETGTYRFKATLDLVNTGNTAPFAEMAGQCTIYLMQAGSSTRNLKTYSSPSGITNGLQVIMDTGFVYLVANDIIHIEITCYSRAKNNGGAPANLTVGLEVTSKLELIWNPATRYKGLNDLIHLSDYLPDISQADFLGQIRDTCNLRFWMDKARQNVYIESWDNTFSSEIKDISSLVDYSSLSDNPAEMISNNYSRSTLMKWKDDSSDEAYNEHLRKYDSPLTNEVVLTSQFCKDGQETKEHSWSTIVEGYNLTLVDYTKQVPQIWAELITFSPIDFNRKVNFNTRLVHWDGYVACDQSWVFATVSKDHYPKISGVSWGYLYSQFWQKIYHKIDKGKLYPIRIKVKPGFLTQFLTVISDVDKENFRPRYKINIDGVDNYMRLQRITSDGDIAELELIIE